MILIDTSVWIEFLKQNPDFVRTVQPLLETKRVLAFEPVFAELIYGIRNKKEKEIIQAYWQALPRIGIGPDSMLEAANFACSNDYLKAGIGLMDAIIIKAVIEGNHLLWTLDRRIISGIDQKFLFKP